MTNFGELVSAVQRNCNISDARHAGDYTLCVFLLKMRELYRWEHNLPLTQSLPKDEVGQWLSQREQLWESVENSAFVPLPLARGNADPFESGRINDELLPGGHVYSGGYGRYGKPHFFLGRLARREEREGCTVLMSSCEYARDVVAPPAMLQGNTIYVRLESVRRFLWEKIEESGWSHSREPMERAIAAHRFADDAEAALDRMTEAESESMVLHELGEARAGRLLGEGWNEMLASLSRSRAEIMVRAVRDILADSLVTLPALIEAENWASLHFYFANFSGMRRYLYPELAEAYRAAVVACSPTPLAARVEADTARWIETANALLALHIRREDNLDCAVEHLLVREDAEAHCNRG